MADYQIIDEHTVKRNADGAFIPVAPGNRDYRAYLDWVALGNTADPADPPPDPPPDRDALLLAAVDAAKTAVATGGVFTAPQVAVLQAVFDGLGEAISESS